jgi:hypothetical protein
MRLFTFEPKKMQKQNRKIGAKTQFNQNKTNMGVNLFYIEQFEA